MTDREDALIRDDALNILRDILEWKLSKVRWETVAVLLDTMAADPADLDAVSAVTTKLEMAGPVRITRIGATPTEPPPPKVLERVNTLVDKLSRQSDGA